MNRREKWDRGFEQRLRRQQAQLSSGRQRRLADVTAKGDERSLDEEREIEEATRQEWDAKHTMLGPSSRSSSLVAVKD